MFCPSEHDFFYAENLKREKPWGLAQVRRFHYTWVSYKAWLVPYLKNGEITIVWRVGWRSGVNWCPGETSPSIRSLEKVGGQAKVLRRPATRRKSCVDQCPSESLATVVGQAEVRRWLIAGKNPATIAEKKSDDGHWFGSSWRKA